MSTSKMTGRLAVAGMCSVLAVGLGACAGGGHANAAGTTRSSASSRATSPGGMSGNAVRRPAANGVNLGSRGLKAATSTGVYAQVTNLTPYPWTLVPNGTWGLNVGPYDSAPPATLLPGQTATWSAHNPWGARNFVRTLYTFQDAAGHTHVQQVNEWAQEVGDPLYYSYSQDVGFDANHHLQLTESPDFHMAMDPDGYGRHGDAIWNSPTTITIDALQDPAAAANAVDNELPRAIAAQTHWAPNPGVKGPTSVKGPTTRASSLLTNYSSLPATLGKGQGTSKGQSTTLGVEVSHSGSTNIDGVVFKDAESVTGDHSWGSGDSVNTTVSSMVDPGQTGWINKRPTISSMTGHLVFTTANNTTFDLSNVTISMGDIANTGAGGVPPGMDFSATECVLADCASADSPTGGTALTKAGAANVRAGMKATVISASPGQVVTIDGATDPADAIEALKKYQDATDRSFIPTADPTFAHSSWAPVDDETGQEAPSVSTDPGAQHPTAEMLTVAHQETSSWSLGGSVQETVGFNLAGIISQELSVKFTQKQTWTSDTTNNQSITIQAAPGKTVWIEASTGTASYTGNFVFTAGGVRYQVNNVTITQPGSADVDAMSNTSYRVEEVNNTTAGVSPTAASGKKAISKLPKLRAYINHGH
ncbi:hypothetical protein [Leekyejoonella antrihumi]|uniref:Uncharacterized protein n=1 Tax=Leekyejoonella antrihumi TaxID=1660198 RepID=A0A563DRJ7_9MICO|nr:hypothetical protein [Leekyejoonella antrihumi]TWP32860.1 hypothetical protein FGL98_23120 [Leekyejoonella antrihumi]